MTGDRVMKTMVVGTLCIIPLAMLVAGGFHVALPASDAEIVRFVVCGLLGLLGVTAPRDCKETP